MRQTRDYREVTRQTAAHREVSTDHRKLMRLSLALIAVAFAVVAFGSCARPAVAGASVEGDACSAAGDVNGIAGKACALLGSSGKIVNAGKKLIGGHIGGAVKSLLAGGGSAASASTALGLTAIVAWVVAGAKFSLDGYQPTSIPVKVTTGKENWYSTEVTNIDPQTVSVKLEALASPKKNAPHHKKPATAQAKPAGKPTTVASAPVAGTTTVAQAPTQPAQPAPPGVPPTPSQNLAPWPASH